MKKRFYFKSIYAKFTILFLGIWWVLNSLTFGFVMFIMSKSIIVKSYIDRYELFNDFHKIRFATGSTFFVSIFVGTIIILIAVRGIVKPIKRISNASKEVAKGNFDIEVEVTSKDEIGQLTTDFNLMTKELKNIELLRKDFVSNVSHEFKTPITSIKGYSILIRDSNLTNEQIKEFSDIIANESERLSLLSSNLLKLSELDSKMIREQATEFSLDEQIRKTILILEVQWEKKQIDFDIELEKGYISGHMHLLQEVWLNLIQNAIKFSCHKGTIKISLTKCNDYVKVVIADNGFGISADEKDRIFERFYKGDKSRSNDGNGLGLTIVKRIIDLSKGRIYFSSELGKGSSFVVELPYKI